MSTRDEPRTEACECVRCREARDFLARPPAGDADRLLVGSDEPCVIDGKPWPCPEHAARPPAGDTGLREALLRYGDHDHDCPVRLGPWEAISDKCECGFSAALSGNSGVPESSARERDLPHPWTPEPCNDCDAWMDTHRQDGSHPRCSICGDDEDSINEPIHSSEQREGEK